MHTSKSFFLAFALFLLSLSFAQTGLGRVGTAVNDMCSQLACIIPIVAMLMIIGAGIVYSAGQMMGAETRGPRQC